MSLVGMAEDDRSSAVSAYKTLSSIEQARKNQEQSLEAQHDAQQASNAGSALSMGVTAGMYTGNPLIGLGVGLASLALGSLF